MGRVGHVATLEMLSACEPLLTSLAGAVQVLLVHLARGVEQMESLRFESVNPTFLLGVSKAAR